MKTADHDDARPDRVDNEMVPDDHSRAGDSRLWIWLTLPPLAAVLGGIITITLALKYPDPVIHSDTYKLGKVMAVDNRTALAAQRLNLSATLSRDGAAGELRLVLAGDVQPPELRLLWIHPTQAALDRGAVLSRQSLTADGAAVYHGVLPEPPLTQAAVTAGTETQALSSQEEAAPGGMAHGVWVVQDRARQWRLEAQAERTMGEFQLLPVVR